MASPFHTLQAAASLTFKIPAEFLNGRLTLPQLWDFHLNNSAEHPLFVYNNSDGDIETITWSRAVRAMHRTASIIRPNVAEVTVPSRVPVVGVLAHLKDIPSWWALITGLIKLGACALLISSRNSAEALAHIVEQAECRLVLLSDEAAVRDLANASKEYLSSDYKVNFVESPLFGDIFLDDTAPFIPLPPCSDIQLDNPALILQSSGSTAFPKLVTSTHRTLVHWSLVSYFGDKDMCNCTLAANGLPLFHSMGITMSIMLPSSSGQVSIVNDPTRAVQPPTPETVLATAITCKADYIYTVPSFIEQWSEKDEHVLLMTRFKLIMFAGGPLKTHIGDNLTSRGVRLCSVYGTSESGAVSRILYDQDPKDWEYIQATRQTEVYWRRHEGIEELFEPVVLESDYKSLAATNTSHAGKRAYATGDLFEKHPSKEGLWRVYGRVDDQIIHSTGEKTNPRPIEMIIIRDPLISQAIIFGHGRRYPGVIIERASYSESEAQLDVPSFIEAIWPTLEKANKFAPTHSRIYKSMVIVAKPSKLILLTSKQTLRRNATLTAYSDEINAIYAAPADIGLVTSLLPPKSWTAPEVLAFIRHVLGLIKPTIKDHQDFFIHGVDSLQATMIKNAITQAFRDSGLNPKLLEGNFVYAHPTVAFLARYVAQVARLNGETYGESLIDYDVNVAVAELTHPFTVTSSATVVSPDGEVILVTGTTGRLGAHLLVCLIGLPSVTRVYAVNRSSSQEDMRRKQQAVFKEQGLSEDLADSEKILYVIGDIALPGLGLQNVIEEDVLSSVTTIIHAAWMVNFNLSLASFRPLLWGVRHIAELALKSRLNPLPRVIFASSVSTGQSPAAQTGYASSKWVAEKVLIFAQTTTSLQCMTIRIGQLCGSTTNGNWKKSEWFPAIVDSASEVGSLPDRDQLISWLPIDVAARAITDIRHSNLRCVQIVHPRPVPWNSIVTPIAKQLKLPILPYGQWLQRLQTVAVDTETVKRILALKLLDFFQSLNHITNLAEDPDQVVLPLSESETLQTIRPLGASDVEKWLAFWKV